MTFDLRVQNPEVLRLFERAPGVTFFHVRDAVGGMFGSHRREWLQRKQVDFRSRGLTAQNLTSREANTGGARGFSSFFYRVEPAEKRATTGSKLSDIKGESFTHSEAALGLEQGGTFRPTRGRRIAIPIGVTLDSTGRAKSRWVTPAKYRRGEGNQLIAIPNRRGTIILYQVKGGRSKKAAQSPGAFSHVSRPKRILLPAYVLVPEVTRKARLRYMKTWDELADDRARRMKRAADRIVEGIARGKS